MRNTAASLATLLLAMLLAGCGGVLSENPASEGADTRMDERLIGLWTLDLAESRDNSGQPPGEVPKDQSVLAIGRDPKARETLRLAITRVDGEGELTSEIVEIRPTRIGDRDYLSLPPQEAGAQTEKAPWIIVRYDVTEAGRLQVRILDENVVAASVRAGEVEGTVEEWKPATGGESSVNVSLTAPTAALRGWLEVGGDALFQKGLLVLRRLGR